MTDRACSNIGSIEGDAAHSYHSAYCASKGGLNALTRDVALECRERDIRCNAVAPGWIETELNLDFVASVPDP